MLESDICLKFANATVDNFNLILSKNKIDSKFEFEELSIILDKLLLEIGVVLDKKSENYERGKKRFSKFLNYNYKFIKNNLELDDKIIILFKDSPNYNWYLLHLSVVSYLSYIQQTKVETTFNLKGMIDKITIEIEEYYESDSEQDKPDTQNMLVELSKHIPQTGTAPTLMKGLIGDIKNILSDGDELKTKNIIDISKDLSKKYQTMIENGDVNMGDLLSGVLGLINNPDSLNGEFDDIDVSKLPDPDSILKDMANDPKLKEVMGMMGNNKGMPDMGMFGSMMANMVNSNTNTDDKSISDLEKEIEQMMREVQEAETDHNKDVD